MVEFIEHECKSAHEFLDALRLSNSRWWLPPSPETPDLEWQRDWIFRGQGSGKWLLLPKAWRKLSKETPESAFEHLKNMLRHSMEFQEAFERGFASRNNFTLDTLKQALQDTERLKQYKLKFEIILQGFTEIWLVNQFSDLADELGFSGFGVRDQGSRIGFVSALFDLYFPDGRVQVNRARHGISDRDEQFSFWKQLPFALAQHHSIPTRLLDWTRNPVTAAFFAAAYVTDTKLDDQIVVYAFHREMLTEHIRCLEIPSSSNDFLRAQSGLFTIDLNGEYVYLENGEYQSLEESEHFLQRNYEPQLYPQKLTLPVSEVPALLRLLWLERVTHAHLMPTLDHVAEATLMKVRLSENLSSLR